MSETTQTLIEKYDSYKFYETLEIQTRTGESTYSGSWVDVSEFLNDSNPIITKRLDFENFGLGQFFSGSLDITLDNRTGKFSDVNELYSMFFATYTRSYSKVRYKAGYYDTDGTTKIDETVFTGLINEDDFVTDLQTGQLPMTAIDYAGYLQYEIIPDGTFTGSATYTSIVSTLFGLGNISLHITHTGGNINPDFNLTFDDTSVFNGRTVFDVLTDVTIKSNSVWYIDDSDNIIVSDRSVKAGTSFEFKGGYYGAQDTNILSIKRVKSRYNLINFSKYTNVNSTYLNAGTDAELKRDGVHIFELNGDDITNGTTIQSVLGNIRESGSTPPDRLVVESVFMPNVLSFLDPATVSYQQAVQPFDTQLVWNADTYLNDVYHWGTKVINDGISDQIQYKYFGFEHNPRDARTNHFLVEEFS